MDYSSSLGSKLNDAGDNTMSNLSKYHTTVTPVEITEPGKITVVQNHYHQAKEPSGLLEATIALAVAVFFFLGGVTYLGAVKVLTTQTNNQEVTK